VEAITEGNEAEPPLLKTVNYDIAEVAISAINPHFPTWYKFSDMMPLSSPKKVLLGLTYPASLYHPKIQTR
jgi:hypothetical protein